MRFLAPSPAREEKRRNLGGKFSQPGAMPRDDPVDHAWEERGWEEPAWEKTLRIRILSASASTGGPEGSINCHSNPA